MPLPIGNCADDIPSAVCCDSIFDIADRLRAVAYSSVMACLPETCEGFRSYVTVGDRPSEPIGDALVVSIIDSVPTSQSRSSTGQTTLGATIQQARFDIWLTENGWPQARVDELGNVISVPPADLIHAVALHSYAHAEAMYRGVLEAYAKRTLFPQATFRNIHKVDIAGLFNVRPAAFTVGWRIPVTVQYMFNPMIAGS